MIPVSFWIPFRIVTIASKREMSTTITTRKLIKQLKFAWRRNVNNLEKKGSTAMSVQTEIYMTIYLAEYMKRSKKDSNNGAFSMI